MTQTYLRAVKVDESHCQETADQGENPNLGADGFNSCSTAENHDEG